MQICPDSAFADLLPMREQTVLGSFASKQLEFLGQQVQTACWRVRGLLGAIVTDRLCMICALPLELDSARRCARLNCSTRSCCAFPRCLASMNNQPILASGCVAQWLERLTALRPYAYKAHALPTELKRRMRNFYESLGLPLAEKGICALPAWVLRLCDESCRFRRLPATQRTKLAWPFGCRPPWPNGQGVGLLIRRLWV